MSTEGLVYAQIDLPESLQQPHRDLNVGQLPSLLLPRKGSLGLIDYEKAFTVDPHADIFELRGIDRQRGALVLVRPDQYVAHVLGLDGYTELEAFFEPVLINQQ